MPVFIFRFLLCNVYFSLFIGLLLLLRRILGNRITARAGYCLWYPFFFLLSVPFWPMRAPAFLRFLQGRLFRKWPFPGGLLPTEGASPGGGAFTASFSAVNPQGLALSPEAFPFAVGTFLFVLWLGGILISLLCVVRALRRMRLLAGSASLLQNADILRLYRECLSAFSIRRAVPVYSADFLSSPMLAGLLRPRIYLPKRLTDGYGEPALRYMLLHELQHYKRKDAVGNLLTTAALILYWFHPLVRIAARAIRTDREIACDAAVLSVLKKEDYAGYGHALIDFAEKSASPPFPLAAGLSGNMRQLKRRVESIAAYEKPGRRKRLVSAAVFSLTAAFALGSAPMLLASAGSGRDGPDFHAENVSLLDAADYFQGYDGSLVLYDAESDAWRIYNPDGAMTRRSPDSTYKIYDALFGLDAGLITPQESDMAWDGTRYPFASWQRDQNLSLAMQNSVNWYFREIDAQIGLPALRRYVKRIGYGNEAVREDDAPYWMEASLQISPIEQILLLRDLYAERLPFDAADMAAVKDAICLASAGDASLHGKTGTGRAEGKDVNGWFVGYVENTGRASFFAVNIAADEAADGSAASAIALSVLSDLDIWRQTD